MGGLFGGGGKGSKPSQEMLDAQRRQEMAAAKREAELKAQEEAVKKQREAARRGRVALIADDEIGVETPDKLGAPT